MVKQRAIKRLILIPLSLLLGGCATYYYPVVETAETPHYVEGDSSYYTESDTRYVSSRYAGYSIDYSGAAYYPWWSVDYFYLGSHRRHSTFSIGFNFGHGYDYGWYDPFYHGYYPYSYAWYDHYFPYRYSYWHSPFYRHSHFRYGWNDYYWRHRYYRDHRPHRPGRHPGGGPGHDRVADDPGDRDRRRRDRSSVLDPGYSHGNPDRFAEGERHGARDRRPVEDRRRPVVAGGPQNSTLRTKGENSSITSYPSIATGAGSSGKTMTVRRKTGRKPSATRPEPLKGHQKSVTKVTPSPGTVIRSPEGRRVTAYSTTRSGTSTVRSLKGAKKGRTRPTPVDGGIAPAVTGPSKHQGSTPVVSVRRGTSTIRSLAGSKAGSSKLEPVRTRPSVSGGSARQARSGSGPVARVAPGAVSRTPAPAGRLSSPPVKTHGAPKASYSASPKQNVRRSAPASPPSSAAKPATGSEPNDRGTSRQARKTRR